MRHRSVFLIPLLAATLAISACGGGPAQPPASSAPQAVAAPPAQAAPAPAAPAWQDLNGARASSGESELQRRGFDVAARRGLTAFWKNAPSQTCLRVVTGNGRYTVSQVPFTPQTCPP